MSKNTIIFQYIKQLCLLLGLCLLAGCQTAQPNEVQATPVQISKILATVPISPTPNEEQVRATELVSTPIPTLRPPTRTPQATAYVGSFAGVAQVENLSPRIDTSLFAVAPYIPPTDVAIAQACPIVVGEQLQTVWETNEVGPRFVGCPLQTSFGFFANVQFFENGVIYQREDTREMWAIIPSAELGRYWYVEIPPGNTTDGIEAPQGLIVPTGDFGGMWRGVLDLQENLGFAVTGRQRISMGLQRFERGAMLLDATSGQVFVLRPNGDALGPF